MPRKFKVDMRTYAFAVAEVELTDTEIESLANSLGLDVDELDYDNMRELIATKAYDRTPTLGVCCIGGNYPGQSTLTLGDEWDVDEGGDAVREVTAL